MKDSVDAQLRDQQAGFRKDRLCTDQIATLRIIVEQSIEWNSSLYINFIDYEKAFDGMDSTTLWKLLRHYGVPQKIANRSGSDEDQRALQAGLLYLALTEPDPRHSFCTDIVLTSRDNLTYVLSEMTRLVAETWPKMTQSVRCNLISLLGEFISTKTASVEVLMLHVYRRMTNHHLSPQQAALVTSNPSVHLSKLRQKELVLVEELVRKNVSY
ncbi:unnamed protein product [Schistosoma mattheei]|uniref:Uncharacterized protein n=1 Tax=Schistosoma mattheei TaxID=31246 RepID=A0A183Q4S1_9TREM|nr:unnamed protein product [Schistosoma mattheei]